MYPTHRRLRDSKVPSFSFFYRPQADSREATSFKVLCCPCRALLVRHACHCRNEGALARESIRGSSWRMRPEALDARPAHRATWTPEGSGPGFSSSELLIAGASYQETHFLVLSSAPCLSSPVVRVPFAAGARTGDGRSPEIDWIDRRCTEWKESELNGQAPSHEHCDFRRRPCCATRIHGRQANHIVSSPVERWRPGPTYPPFPDLPLPCRKRQR